MFVRVGYLPTFELVAHLWTMPLLYKIGASAGSLIVCFKLHRSVYDRLVILIPIVMCIAFLASKGSDANLVALEYCCTDAK